MHHWETLSRRPHRNRNHHRRNHQKPTQTCGHNPDRDLPIDRNELVECERADLTWSIASDPITGVKLYVVFLYGLVARIYGGFIFILPVFLTSQCQCNDKRVVENLRQIEIASATFAGARVYIQPLDASGVGCEPVIELKGGKMEEKFSTA